MGSKEDFLKWYKQEKYRRRTKRKIMEQEAQDYAVKTVIKFKNKK